MSEYSEVVKKLPSAADEVGRMPCSWCKTPTLKAMLNHYGARCFSCYEAYCQESQPGPNVGDKRKGPMDWAHAFKAREDAGEQLGHAQRQMWCNALRWLSVEGARREEEVW